MRLLTKTFNILFIAGLVSACVGTIEDTELEQTKNAQTTIEKIPFAGLQNAEAISHDKVEVSFFPISGDPASITYEIFVNSSETPIFVSGSSLTPNPKGLLVFTVKGLATNTPYSFSVSATNNKTGGQSDEGDSKFATTFPNTTADFTGVSSLRLPAGVNGQSSIVVEWVPATSTGTTFSPAIADPVAYEIIYISEDGGAENINNSSYAGPDRIVSQVPNPIPASPQLSEERTRTLTGLQSGKDYFVQVRAIHKGFADFGGPGNPSYKREENTKFLKIKTAVPTGTYDFETTGVAAASPDSEPALSSIDVTWVPATGDFYNYRVFYTDAADPTDPDALTTTDMTAIMGGTGSGSMDIIDADDTFTRIDGLLSYTNYQIKVVACQTPACGETDRTESVKIVHPTFPSITPFEGIDYIDHPRSDLTTDRIHLNFNSPVISSGYITDMELYCYTGSADADPKQLYYNQTFPWAGATPPQVTKAGCDGLTRLTQSPSSQNAFGSFEEIDISGIVPDVGNEYCFSLVPIIDPSPDPGPMQGWTDVRDLANAIVKCIVPEIKTPTLEEFPGKDAACDVNNRDLTVNWSLPSAGMYNRFEVFLKENDGTPFKFSDAVAAAPGYSSVDNLAAATITHTFTNLVPGRRYYAGVLAYLWDSPTKYYSEYNLSTGDCLIPMPEAEFDMWHEIFAIGPKVDGLRPPDLLTGERYHITETLDDHGTPIEALLDPADTDHSDGAPLDPNFSLYAARTPSQVHDGVDSAMHADQAGLNRAQYSNSGIVRIAWKDVTFYSGAQDMNDMKAIYEPEPLDPDPSINKGLRTYGYKVYRSEDNKLTWQDLTVTAYPFQSAANDGLLIAKDVDWVPLSNDPAITDSVVYFTDYSVKAARANIETERARIYWYKVVPIFDGKPIAFKDGKTENIIKVTLPPPNMALVHRNMANRTMCNELGIAIQKSLGGVYYCDWNGLGSSGLTPPGKIGETVYDIGGDLLVDRFELGCNVTRGAHNDTQSWYALGGWMGSGTDDGLKDFAGDADTGSDMIGCVARYDDSSGDQPYELLTGPDLGSGTGVPASQINWRLARAGDCFGGRDESVSLASRSCAPPPPGTWEGVRQMPGLFDEQSNCENGANNSYLGDDAFDIPNFDLNQDSWPIQEYQAQSEYAAVWYTRDQGTNRTLPDWVGAGGNKFIRNQGIGDWNSGQCFVNLPIINPTNNPAIAGAWTARWIPVSRMFGNLRYDPGGDDIDITLYDRTITQIRGDSDATPLFGGNGSMYKNGTEVPPVSYNPDGTNPTRRYYRDFTPLAKIFSSNNAKLPPISNMAQIDLYNVCQQYRVDVGVMDGSNNWFSTITAPLPKRIMRKKEFTVVSAWPEKDTYNEAFVTSVEDGTYVGPRIFGATPPSDDNQSCNNNAKILDGQIVTRASDILTTVYPTDCTTCNPYVMTGSSAADNILLNVAGMNLSTQKCVSKFGIHDLVGNIQEYVAEQIHCNFGGESMYIGSTPGTESSSIRMVGTGTGGASNRDLTQVDCGSADNATCGTGTTGDWIPSFNFHSFYDAVYNKADNIHVWVLANTNTGKCSTIEWGGDREIGPGGGTPMLFANGLNFNSIYAGATYNTTLVDLTEPGKPYIRTFDFDALEDVRNGDGAFLDFGQVNLGVPIGKENVLGLQVPSTDPASFYFSPTLGLPLKCQGSSCLAGQADLNREYTTDQFVTTHSLTAGDYDNPDFPIHNSDIIHDGLGTIHDVNEWAWPNTNDEKIQFISQIENVGGPGDLDDIIEISHPDDTTNFAARLASSGGAIDGDRTRWNVDRNHPMYMLVGGDASDTFTGRYTTKLFGESPASMRYDWNRGGRCVLKINGLSN